ncbi:Shikimate kinase [Alicyclobacillus acidocaldarius subsp. acidocaldarius Tc-4-1]|uniref:Shikimate kinase n=1 Tax=Alicyclobacillus acidocaldarius (strain Tc-4-1) TaxID=1048834 RepID=F8IL66_ALIAT|nr:Shikimate kinase [Alicyclobacillus acidocaldarius subsp. acidocaldarius Tc-4-1]
MGFMGCGKSTVGPVLARRLGVDFVDLDLEIQQMAGRTIAEIFEQDGERAFRSLESECLARCARQSHLVVAPGGGVVTVQANRRLLRSHFHVAYLRARPATLAERLRGQAEHRPLLRGHPLEDRIARLMRERAAFYDEVASQIVDVDGKSPEAIAEEISSGLKST